MPSNGDLSFLSQPLPGIYRVPGNERRTLSEIVLLDGPSDVRCELKQKAVGKPEWAIGSSIGLPNLTMENERIDGPIEDVDAIR